MSVRPTRLLREERGFTLVELLVSMTIGMVVLISAIGLMDSGARSSQRTHDRVDTTQRGRTTMTQIQRHLRSQVCLDADTPPITSGDATTVTYYTDADTDAYFVPQKHVLWYESSWKGGRGAIREYIYRADQAAPQAPPAPAWTFAGAPTTRVLMEDVGLQAGVPFLRYYSFSAPLTPVSTPLDTDLDNDTLPANSMAKVVRVDVSFRALPGRQVDSTGPPTGNQTDALQDSDFDTTAYVRNSDYTDQDERIWGPRCS